MSPTMNQQNSINRITELLSWYVQQVRDKNVLELYDINHMSEDFLVELFREVYDYTGLVNLNSIKANYPGIDLADESTGVAIQVTSKKSGTKVKETLETFVANKEYKRFQRLIIYIITEKQKSYSDKKWPEIPDGFDFDRKRDIRDHNDLLRDIGLLPINIIRRVEEVCESYFGDDGSVPSLVQATAHLAPYLQAVVRGSQNLPLVALDPANREDTPVSLGQVFINLDAGAENQISESSKPGMKCYELYSAALAHIHENQHLILLGDPGSGKSTLLRFLTYCLAQHTLNPQGNWLSRLQWQKLTLESEEDEPSKAWAVLNERRRRDRSLLVEEDSSVSEIDLRWTGVVPVPIYIELRNFARTDFDPTSPMALWDFHCQRLQEAGFKEVIPALKSLLLAGVVIFLLDGVDEVPLTDRPRIWQAVRTMATGAGGSCRWISTCRVLSFVAEEAPIGVPERTLQSLNSRQIMQFIDSWYQAMVKRGSSNKEEAAGKAHNLKIAVRRRQMMELAENPMLLTIMALVQSYYGTLPDERARLYQMCVETLMLRWQRGKEAAEGEELPLMLAELGDQQQIERLLWEIAWEAHGQANIRKRAADMPEMEVLRLARKYLGDFSRAEQFLKYTEMRAHLLVGRGGIEDRFYTFPHRTFQEYLAACYLASGRRFPQNAARLASEGDTWREVLSLAAGTLVFNQNNREKALDGAEKVLPQETPTADDEGGWYRVWMAAEMALVVGREAVEQDEVGADILPRLREALACLVNNGYLTPQQRAEAGVALGWLGDPRSDVVCNLPYMVEIPGGAFLMGSVIDLDKDAFHNELPQHVVDIPDYKIGKYPVTVMQYSLFVEAGGYENETYWTDVGWHIKDLEKWSSPRFWDDPHFSVPNQPVVGVSWYESVAYCNWLRSTTGRKFRLPSEAMWEKAARGLDGRIWPWGNERSVNRLNCEMIIGRPTAVGAFPEDYSPYHVYDLAGNVKEWCSGFGIKEAPYPFQLYSYDEEIEKTSAYRMKRGGSYDLYIRYARVTDRIHSEPSYWNNNAGFRVAEDIA